MVLQKHKPMASQRSNGFVKQTNGVANKSTVLQKNNKAMALQKVNGFAQKNNSMALQKKQWFCKKKKKKNKDLTKKKNKFF